MNQVRNELFRYLHDPVFEFLSVVITCKLETNLDYGLFTMVAKILKLREGEQFIEVSSPFQGDSFCLNSAEATDGHRFTPVQDHTCDRFTKYSFVIEQPIPVDGEFTYIIKYREKLNVEQIRPFRLGRKFSLLFKKTFGTQCRQLKYRVILPSRWAHVDFAHPQSNYVSNCEFERQNIHAGDPSVFITEIRTGILTKTQASLVANLCWLVIGVIVTWAWQKFMK